MKIIYSNLKNGEFKIKIESLDDLWYLSNIIDAGDFVKGETVRKIKVGGKEESSDVFKKKIFIKIEVEKTEFGADAKTLRILGKIADAPEDVPRGSHHSFVVLEGTIIAIIKDRWLKYQLDAIKEASGAKTPKILICAFDRESAIFAVMKRQGYEILAEIEGDVQKKRFEEARKSSFFSEIARILKEYAERKKADKIVVGSPAFWKDELMKEIDDELRKKIILATCSSVSRNALDELIKRPEVKEALKQERSAREMNAVDELLREIAKDNLAVYGIKETEVAAGIGAVKILLVTNSLIQKSRSEGFYSRIERIMKYVDNSGGEIMIVSSEHEGGKKLDGLGGIASITRYKINY
ncbi:MAG TPA: mRNA surveillance protein pelota [Candidatus Nanoarchaeia archaeon]|nr:mRNA surveillance protein pelota [Candidatus Nanoarchaeia archaeon]